jgi:ABC-type branched-subunit amino acid transport system substrate-binding protein
MQNKFRSGVLSAVVVLLLVAVSGMAGTPSVASATSAGRSSPAVKTVVVAGLGSAAQFGAAGTGAQAYFNQVNASGQLKGITIKYLGFTDDGNAPASALSAARDLVTQQHVFAIVPDMSQNTPGAYLASQHVPYVGLGLDATFCSAKPTTSLWAFGIIGCTVPANPPRVPDRYGALFTYAAKKTGATHPTFLAFSYDNQTGQSLATQDAASAKGTGFKVVSAKGDIPATVSDWTPYVEQWMTASHGQPAQVVVCLLADQCIPAWTALKAVGFKGVFYDSLGNTALIQGAMAGTVTGTLYNTAPSAGLTQMAKAMDAVAPGTELVGYSNVPGYFSAAMFVAALKKVGNDDTPQAVQKALARLTWQIKGLVGPISYPASTVIPTPSCGELIGDNADGSGFTILGAFSCTSKTYKS